MWVFFVERFFFGDVSQRKDRGIRSPAAAAGAGEMGKEVAGSSLSTSPFGVCSELLLEAAFCVASEGRLDTFSSKSKRPSTAAASSLLGCGW